MAGDKVPAAEASAVMHAPARALSVLYIFAGPERMAGIRDFLESIQDSFNFLLHMREVDLLRSADQDVTDQEFWSSILQEFLLDFIMCS